jgi:hypothetical protein
VLNESLTEVDLADGAVTAGKLATDSVTGAKVADGSLTAADLASAAVTAAKIASGAVTAGKLATDSVTGVKVADGTLTADDLATGAVGTFQLADNAVTTAKVADGSLTAADLATGAVGTAQLADNAVTAAKVADGTLTGAKIAAGSIVSGTTLDAVFQADNDETSATAAGLRGRATAATGDASGVRGDASSTDGTGVYGRASATSGVTVGIKGRVESSEGVAVLGYCADPNAWGLQVTQGKAYFNNAVTMNSTLNVAGYATFAGGHGDLAENYRGRDVEAGDVVVIGKGGVLVKCAKEMDTTAAGIVSTSPSMKLSGRLDDGEGTVPLALVGRVLCKVDATKRAIHEGDLLVSSATPGHAMRAPNDHPKAGTVIGKALEGLEKGTGVIQVLVTLR